MIKFEQGKLVVEVETTSPAEQYCNSKKAMINLMIAAAEIGDNNTLIEALQMNKSLMLSINQIKKIIDQE